MIIFMCLIYYLFYCRIRKRLVNKGVVILEENRANNNMQKPEQRHVDNPYISATNKTKKVKKEKNFYQKWWFWLIVFFVVIAFSPSKITQSDYDKALSDLKDLQIEYETTQNLQTSLSTEFES